MENKEFHNEAGFIASKEGIKDVRTPEYIIFRESKQAPKAPKQPLERPKLTETPISIKKNETPAPKVLLTGEKAKLTTKDSEFWNMQFTKRELKKKIQKENESLLEYQQALGGKEKAKQYLRYSFKTDELKLIPFGDWHMGSESCQVDKIQSTINYIKRTGSAVILMGDLLENANKLSVGAGVYDQIITPMEQMNKVYSMLEPIKSQILVSLCGNHEFRTYKDCGFNPAIILAEKLGVPYGGFKTFIELKVNKFKYTIYATHGSTGARLPWTRMKAVDDVARHVNADVICYGHTHDTWAHPFLEEGIKDHKKLEVLTGGFLGDSPYGYVAMKNLPPMKTGVVKLKFFGDRWDVHASE